MRLFTGIDLPKNVKDRLDALMTRLRHTAHLKWSPAYNLHITTKFIGDWPKERLDELAAALRGVRPSGPVEIGVGGLGWFPSPHNPRVFWAAVRASPTLAELAGVTDRSCAALGIAAEDRPYSPHLTLARVRNVVPLNSMRQAVAQLDAIEFGAFTAECFYLYLSEPGPSGSIYTPLHEFPLPRA